ncbi:MAG: hypothetical protein ACI9Q9_000077 [Flavobacterium sp.]|jgi:hypothetical protein
MAMRNSESDYFEIAIKEVLYLNVIGEYAQYLP